MHESTSTDLHDHGQDLVKKGRKEKERKRKKKKKEERKKKKEEEPKSVNQWTVKHVQKRRDAKMRSFIEGEEKRKDT